MPVKGRRRDDRVSLQAAGQDLTEVDIETPMQGGVFIEINLWERKALPETKTVESDRNGWLARVGGGGRRLSALFRRALSAARGLTGVRSGVIEGKIPAGATANEQPTIEP
ncbi:hypothetical protein [Candidatus Thiodictyon syntrophicum]|uniref:hypothetical protein n=1 Tax=Candidatus Thiodictyon syntrophicum TaxID=1166950 RepID=UPI0012FDFF29|nr:hypothetical protein [Candidatus Thiodictyon syntrophicum]